ncbi:MAG: hypothetical protein R3321_11435 [Nitrososphaeraceae archaeon]|nr:hypothetical protein [Nitrososphaeraceae archaeon]
MTEEKWSKPEFNVVARIDLKKVKQTETWKKYQNSLIDFNGDTYYIRFKYYSPIDIDYVVPTVFVTEINNWGDNITAIHFPNKKSQLKITETCRWIAMQIQNQLLEELAQ